MERENLALFMLVSKGNIMAVIEGMNPCISKGIIALGAVSYGVGLGGSVWKAFHPEELQITDIAYSALYFFGSYILSIFLLDDTPDERFSTFKRAAQIFSGVMLTGGLISFLHNRIDMISFVFFSSLIMNIFIQTIYIW